METKSYKVNLKALKTIPEINCKLNVLRDGEVIAYKKRKDIEADLDYLILTNARYKMLNIYGENACFWNITEFPDKFRTTSELTTCFNMFDRCLQVKHIDLSHFDTSNVTDFRQMFFRCENLEKLDASYLDTSKATKMSGMFMACDALKELDVATFDTANVTDVNSMFDGCRFIKSLDLSSWDVSQVTNMSRMFRECMSLETLDISGWDTSKVENFCWLFQYCGENLKEIKGVFDLKSAKRIDQMFYEGCPNLKKVKFRNVSKNFSAKNIGLRDDQIEIVS